MSKFGEAYSGGAGFSPEGQTGHDDSQHRVVRFDGGDLLKRARESSGLHIAALAVMLKVPVKKLEALEAGQFHLLPDAVFCRALASSVCRTLKVDPLPILERLPQTEQPTLGATGHQVNTPYRFSSARSGSYSKAQLSGTTLAIGLVLILATTSLVFFPTIKGIVPGWTSNAIGGLAVSESAASGDVTTLEKNSHKGMDSANEPAPTFSGRADSSFGQPSSQAGGQLSPVLASLPGFAAEQGDPAKTATIPARLITFTATNPTWVEVIDSKGLVVLRRTLARGEIADASGATPLTAVVGSAESTKVQVRGESFDLKKVSVNNVARFEVK